MNDQSGLTPGSASIVPLDPRERLPGTGLHDLVVARPQADGNQVNLQDLLRVVMKWWWLIAAITVGFVLAAVVISLLITPKYSAEIMLEVNPENVRTIQVGELQPAPVNAREFVETQVGLLKSRALAERVARDLNLARNEAIIPSETPRAAADKAAANVVRNSMTAEVVRDSRLINVQVVSTDAGLAAGIANSYGKNFIESNLERRYEATSYARNFLEQRIATVKDRLEDSERKLVAYAKREGIVTLNVDSGDGGGRTEQSIDAASLVALNDALSMARAERITAEQQYRQTQQNSSTTGVLANQTIQTLTTQRAELQSQYQEKLGIFQPDYPQMAQLRARIAALDTAIRQETAKVGGASRSDYQAALAKEGQLEARVNGLKSDLLDLRERSIQYTILQREVDTNRALYDSLLQRYKEVGVAGGVGANETSVVDPAEVPGAPFQPNLPLNIVIGLFAGLVVGLGTAFGLEWMDDTIKTPDDVATKLKISPLGVVPAAPKGASVQEQLQDSRSLLSEAYQSVRTALQFSTEQGMPRSLVVTSTRAGEGKSTTALSLAHSSAILGARVLLIDADLRKPTFRGSSDHPEGLSSLLSGSGDLEGSIQPTVQPGLYLLPAGTIPPNPAELIAAGRFSAILDQVTKMFDYVVVDAPPVLGLADVPLLSSHCEGTLIVIEAGSIRRSAAVNSVNRLRAVDARILGAILTKFSAASSGYGYGYGYGYGDDAYAYREGDEPKKQIELLKNREHA